MWVLPFQIPNLKRVTGVDESSRESDLSRFSALLLSLLSLLPDIHLGDMDTVLFSAVVLLIYFCVVG